MEDVKWLLRRCGLPILLLLFFVIAGVFCWGKQHAEKQKVAEEVWEPPVEIENSEAETEEVEDADTSTESAYWFIPQASDDLLSEKEKEQLQSTVLSAAESVREIYKDIVIADAPSYSSGINEFTHEQRKAVVEQLGRSGLVSVEEDTAMQNHEAIEAFYADYLDGQDSMVTVFDEVVVTETENEKAIVLELRVAQSDMGKVIGKQGRIAKAIRSVVKAAASKEEKKVIVEIMQ